MTDKAFEFEDDDIITDEDEESAGSSLVGEVASDARLDKAVADTFPEISRSAAAKLISEGKVTLSGETVGSKSVVAKKGEEISVVLPPPIDCKALPEDIPVDILYEDDDIIVVNKPKGMVVHPAPGHYSGTLVNALLFRCDGRLSGINGVIRPGIVHRIDKDTSGVLVVAKNDDAHARLSEMIKKHDFKRIYKALLIGAPKEQSGTVDAPIGRNPGDRKKMAVTPRNSREATTHYRVLESFRGFSFCEMQLETGRTHQIRVHMAHIGHPVAADPLYSPGAGKNPFGEEGQFLHAEVLGFKHPMTGEYMEFKAPIPEYFEKTLDALRKKQQ